MTSEPVESVDFRTQKMPSKDGLGKARRRWNLALAELAEDAALRVVEPTARRAALETVMSRGGFWLLWQLEGGFDGLRRLGLSEASIYRKIKSFRESFGAHPDEYKFPGVMIDVEEYVRAVSEGAHFPRVVKDATPEGPYTTRKTRK
jgi:hypothetical protein